MQARQKIRSIDYLKSHAAQISEEVGPGLRQPVPALDRRLANGEWFVLCAQPGVQFDLLLF